jgi:manganese-dependent inorganic pyrophosphatase
VELWAGDGVVAGEDAELAQRSTAGPTASERRRGTAGRDRSECAAVPPRIYVTGHKNPDTDSIASAIGYAELLGRLDTENTYIPVRLGDVNAQTRWVLDKAGAGDPDFLPHILLRTRDVMQTAFAVSRQDEPVRTVGLAMAREDRDVVPVVDDHGKLVGVVTERGLARRYIRESRETSSLVDTPTAVSAICEMVDGESLVGEDKAVAGRVWVQARGAESPTGIEEGDVVVVGDRPAAQKRAIELGAALIVCSNGDEPDDEVLELARERGTSVVLSPLDSYVTGRMITLSAPCRSVMDAEPLTVRPDDLLDDIEDSVKDIHYRAAVAVDQAGKPVGLLSRADLLNPKRRRVVLVDHAEQGQSVAGVEHAEIVEILDHHHIGSIETTIPVRATFDPVGSTATLVVERFRQNGMEPSHESALLLLGAVLSDTVILNSPTTTDRDRAVVDYFERSLGVDARGFGREMFEANADISGIPAEEVVTRDAKHYEADNGQTLCIAQIETVGSGVLERRKELLEAMDAVRERRGYVAYALMITDIVAGDTKLLVSGERHRIEKALGEPDGDGAIDLPGVMSRKKQLAPRLLDIF